MKYKTIGYTTLTALLLASPTVFAQENDTALSNTAAQGKLDFAVCQSCHDASLNPPKAPPMFGVQRRYKRQHDTQQGFVDAVVTFVSQPSEDAALMKRPIKKLGLMPAMPLGDEMLSGIASYIYEASFEPPCDHWNHAMSSTKGKGSSNHQQHVQEMYDEFCS
jgi:hypothetical protein